MPALAQDKNCMDRVVIVDVLDIVEPYRFPILCSFMAVIFFGIYEETI